MSVKHSKLMSPPAAPAPPPLLLLLLLALPLLSAATRIMADAMVPGSMDGRWRLTQAFRSCMEAQVLRWTCRGNGGVGWGSGGRGLGFRGTVAQGSRVDDLGQLHRETG